MCKIKKIYSQNCKKNGEKYQNQNRKEKQNIYIFLTRKDFFLF